MTQENTLSVHDISRELNTGTATTKFILKRFESRFNPEYVRGRPCYPRQAIPMLLEIREYLDEGMLPSEIDQKLGPEPAAPPQVSAGFQHLETHFQEQPNQDIRISKDGLSLIKSLVQDISEQQKRIASAHEKRAVAEERKAVAIEKRAEAEERKAAAMNNIAAALQEMNRLRGQDPAAMAIAQGAAQVIEADLDPALEAPGPGEISGDGSDTGDMPESHDSNALELSDRNLTDLDLTDLDLTDDPDLTDMDLTDLDDGDTLSDDDFLADLEDLTRSVEELTGGEEADGDSRPGDMEPVEMDDLYALVADRDVDDLSGLLDEPLTGVDDIDGLDNLGGLDDLDDISDLLDTVDSGSPDISDLDSLDDPAGLDDLTRLLDDVAMDPVDETDIMDVQTAQDLDDLSLLISPPEDGLDNLDLLIDPPGPDLDDLSLLVAPQQMDTGEQDLDDLSLLVDPLSPGREARDLDDLSLLLDSPEPDLDDLSLLVAAPEPGLDDLSQLVNAPESVRPQADEAPMDDLSALVEDAPQPEEPSLKPDISREDDLQAYKTAVMQIILKLKKQGFTAQETTDRLNRDGVETISGKPQWQVKAIAQIYKFMDAAK